MKANGFWSVLACGTFVLGATALAQEKKPAEKPAAPSTAKTADKPAAGTHAPGGDEAKMMETWKKAATPGEGHAKLASLIGKWTYVTKMRMDANQPWQESTGKAEYKWGLGNRILFHEVKGNPGPMDAMMGSPFEGHGMTGYDNTEKHYYNVWVDNWGTAALVSTGSADSSGKTFTYNSDEHVCPVTGEKKRNKSVLKIEGDDKVVFQMYDKGPDGKEFVGLEVTYTRQK